MAWYSHQIDHKIIPLDIVITILHPLLVIIRISSVTKIAKLSALPKCSKVVRLAGVIIITVAKKKKLDAIF